jgi:multisubunit Na+/H+ antiporter MnhG subunit
MELLEGLSVETLGAGGVVIAVIVFFVLWRLFKVAVKIVLFIVVMAVLAGGVAVYLERAGGRVRLPTPPTVAP